MQRTKIGKIVVALDFSDHTEATFSQALSLAEKFEAELVILNVINSDGLDHLEQVAQMGYTGLDTNHYLVNLSQERQKLFNEICEPELGGVSNRFVQKVGTPYRQIIETAQEEKADLLVIGAKGRSSLAEMLFGVNAEKIIRRAPCSVVSVR